MSTMPVERPRTSPKDFFLHLLNIIMLYISAYSFGQLLFFIINFYFPDQLSDMYNYYGSGSFEPIRWGVSALIVAFPAYVIGARSLNSDYAKNPEKKNLRVKQWLEYLTLFGTALIILVTFMTVVYKFLGGEITTRFILKALTIIYISGSMFAYYLLVVKYGIEQRLKQVRIFAAVVSVTILAAIVGGFLTIGSPQTERMRQFDRARLDRIQNVVSNATYYYQKYRKLPATISDIQTVVGYPVDFTDPDTKEPLEYAITKEPYAFHVCATFALDRDPRRDGAVSPVIGKYDVYGRPYTKGKNCFDYVVDPQDYPPIK